MEKSEDTIYGIRAVLEAINTGESINKVFVQKGLTGALSRELQDRLNKGDFNVSYVPVEKLDRLVQGNHQGIVARISPVKFADLEETVERILERTSTPLFSCSTRSMTSVISGPSSGQQHVPGWMRSSFRKRAGHP